MMRKIVATFSLAVFALAASAGKTTQQQNHLTHSCCYCNCRMSDYHKQCHKLCVLPESKNKKIRAFNQTENRLCIELCALKKEGTEHLKHQRKAD